MSNAFQFIIYLNRNSRGNVVFDSVDQYFKITNLIGVLPFAGNVEQLCRAMETGARQNFRMNLFAAQGEQWLFECSFVNRFVWLNLWLKDSLMKHRDALFSWGGSFGAFRDGIRII